MIVKYVKVNETKRNKTWPTSRIDFVSAFYLSGCFSILAFCALSLLRLQCFFILLLSFLLFAYLSFNKIKSKIIMQFISDHTTSSPSPLHCVLAGITRTSVVGPKQGQKNTVTPGYTVESIVMAAATAVSAADAANASGSHGVDSSGLQQAFAWYVKRYP